MAVHFRVPDQVSPSTMVVDTFLGVDYSNAPGNVDKRQSPNGQNMIRDVPGKIRKSMGYELVRRFDGKINGYHKLKKDKEGIIHAGTKLYRENGTVLYEQANNAPSKSWQLNDSLTIIDGAHILIYDGTSVKNAAEIAKVPLFSIAKSPKGGGTDYEALNLISPKFRERFAGTKDDTVYHLSFSGLDDAPVTVKILNSDGAWVDKNDGFTVDRTKGTVTFNTSPGVSPLPGEDNVEISASRTVSGYADRVLKCDIGILFGVNGASDRLFLSGNPDYPNQDWYSGQYDTTYWPDTGYSQLGTAGSAIIGYSIINNYLATHKDDAEPDRNVIVRRGDLVNSTPAFPIINTLQGPGAVAKRSFAYLSTEPVFLTKLGVFAITPSDISGERYAQNRSYYINEKLKKEKNLEDAVAVVHKDLYWLVVNDHAYILDGLQNIGRAASEPYSTRQYACFYRTNVPASAMWVIDERLYFGTTDGKVCRFFDDPASLDSYNDMGEPIEAWWETPDIAGRLFYKNKTFRYLAVSVAAAVATSVDMRVLRKGEWKTLKRNAFNSRYLSFAQLVFSKFSFSSDTTARTLHTKAKLKRVDKTRYRFENKTLNEPFGLTAWAIEFIESGKYKG